MNKKLQSYKSQLSKVKNLGAAKNGTNTWIKQRISAIFLIPLTLWFVIFILKIIKADQASLFTLISSPWHVILFLLFASTGIYHGTIGFREIIEDYIHCKCKKNFLIILLYFLVFTTIISMFCAILLFHFSTY